MHVAATVNYCKGTKGSEDGANKFTGDLAIMFQKRRVPRGTPPYRLNESHRAPMVND
jgi:hypothetical protein